MILLQGANGHLFKEDLTHCDSRGVKQLNRARGFVTSIVCYTAHTDKFLIY